MTTSKFSGFMSRLVAGTAFAALALAAPHAAGQEEYYADRDITVIVAFSPGGGYDTWARVVAEHLGKHLPGNPDIIVENMPGASTLLATNHVANVSPSDGTVIGAVGRDVFLEPILGNEAAQFTMQDLTFLGSTSTETNVCISMATAEVQTLEDLMENEVILGAQAPGNGTYNYPAALNSILGLNFDIVAGYEAASAVNLAMEQGEVDAVCQSYNSLVTRYPQWFEDDIVNVLFQGGVSADPSVDAPFILDYAETDEQRRQIRFLYAGQFFGRPFIAPTLDEEPRELLRAAFEALGEDEEFLAQVETLGLDYVPVSGAEMEEFAAELQDTPQELVDFILEATR